MELLALLQYTAIKLFDSSLTLLLCQVTVELKNDLCITGILHSVDQYLNVKLENIKLVNEAKYPHMVSFDEDSSASPLMACHFLQCMYCSRCL